MLLICLEIAFRAAVIGYVYSNILIQPGEALNWLYRLFQRFLTKEINMPAAEIPEELIGFKKEAKMRVIVKEHWLLKPLGACSKCVTGQVALWLFLYNSIILKYYYYYGCIFTVLNHVFTICLSILLIVILQKLLSRR